MSQTKAQLIDNLVQPITGAAGSASAPTFSFTADPNTGLYSPGADQLALSTNGTGRLFVDASGNVGVGAAAATILDSTQSAAAAYSSWTIRNTASNGYAQQQFIVGAGGANGQASVSYAPGIFFAVGPTGNDTTTPIIFRNNNSQERLRITSAGLVGVGTSSPGSLLTVKSPGAATTFFNCENSSGTSILRLFQTAGGSGRLIVSDSTGTDFFNVQADQGRVGIGTSSPSYTLDVTGSARITSASPMWLGTTTGDAYIQYGASATTANNWTVGSQADGSFRFFNGTYSSGTERLRITSAGNVGIGTTTPSQPLEVVTASGGGIALRPSTGNATQGLLFYDTASGPWGFVKYDHQLSALSFGTVNSERARIDASGRLLVGTSTVTTTANTSTNNLIAVESTNNYVGVSFTANCNDANGSYLVLKKSRGTSTGSTTVVQSGDEIGNIFFEGTDGSASRSAAAIRVFVDGTPGASDMPGRLVFSTTADGASSPTERMRITQDGRTLLNYGSSASIESEAFGVQTGTILAGRFTNNTNTSGYHGIRASIGSNGNNTSTYHFSGNTQGVNNWYLYGNGTTSYSSDERLKKNIETTRDGYLDDLKQLRVVKYNWKNHEDGTPKELGLIAQEVEQIFPGLVQDDLSPVSDEDSTIYKQLKGSVLPVILLKALQEAAEKIETLEARLSALESA